MDRILVTGAGGYIGSVLTPILLAEGYAVRVVDRLFFGRDMLPEHQSLEIVKEDTRCVDAAHFRDVDAVIDLVALSNDATGDLFEHATWQINHASRARTARLAKAAGARRYIIPSSCSVYGFRPADQVVDETSEPNPLTTYAKANLRAEGEALALADESYCAIVLRLATVFGASPRMRFDLAINGMTHGAWSTGRLPLMRDGQQWRPMTHVQDVARAMVFMLRADAAAVNGQIINVGADANNYQIGELGRQVAAALPRPVDIAWYGDPDHRSYRVSFAKLNRLGFAARHDAAFGVAEICRALESGELAKTEKTITLDWYRSLVKWRRIVQDVEYRGAMFDLDPAAMDDGAAEGDGGWTNGRARPSRADVAAPTSAPGAAE